MSLDSPSEDGPSINAPTDSTGTDTARFDAATLSILNEGKAQPSRGATVLAKASSFVFHLLSAAAFVLAGSAVADAVGIGPSPARVVRSITDAVTGGGEPVVIAYADPTIATMASSMVETFPYPLDDELPGWRIEFVTGDTNIAGYTWSREQRIEIFVRPGTNTDELRRILAHEVGHAVDLTHNSAEDRRAWQAQRGLASVPWWPDSGAADFQTGAGDFAEVFAFSITGDGDDFRSEVAGIPSEEDLALLQTLAFD